MSPIQRTHSLNTAAHYRKVFNNWLARGERDDTWLWIARNALMRTRNVRSVFRDGQ